MLSPIAFDLIIKYFDAVDRAVAARLSRKRPWSEPALTSLLCDLLDEETQEGQNLSYTLRQLNDELNAFDGVGWLIPSASLGQHIDYSIPDVAKDPRHRYRNLTYLPK